MMMPPRNGSFQSGVTLLELIVAILILAILATLAAPALQDFTRSNRVTAQTNELVAFINLARNEAIRRNLDLDDGNEDVVLRLDADGDGWNGNVAVTGETSAPGCPVGVIRCVANTQVGLTLLGDDSPTTFAEIRFDSRGYLADFNETVLCLRHAPCSGARQHRRVRILPSGRVEWELLACSQDCEGEA